MKLKIEYGDERYEFEEKGFFSIVCNDSSGKHNFSVVGDIGTLVHSAYKTLDIGGMIIKIELYESDIVERFAENYKGEVLIEITINDLRFTLSK